MGNQELSVSFRWRTAKRAADMAAMTQSGMAMLTLLAARSPPVLRPVAVAPW